MFAHSKCIYLTCYRQQNQKTNEICFLLLVGYFFIISWFVQRFYILHGWRRILVIKILRWSNHYGKRRQSTATIWTTDWACYLYFYSANFRCNHTCSNRTGHNVMIHEHSSKEKRFDHSQSNNNEKNFF